MPTHCRVKLCGVRRKEDVRLICESGADFIGILVDMPSLRSNTPDEAAALAEISSIPVALLFMNNEFEQVVEVTRRISPAVVQLQGTESEEYVSSLRKELDNGIEIWKAVHLPSGEGCSKDAEEAQMKFYSYNKAGADRILLDTIVKGGKVTEMGGTGKTYDWNNAASIVRKSPCPVLMAGGLTVDNVSTAIRTVRPWGVDLASGIEIEKGVKDPQKIKAFMDAVRSTDK